MFDDGPQRLKATILLIALRQYFIMIKYKKYGLNSVGCMDVLYKIVNYHHTLSDNVLILQSCDLQCAYNPIKRFYQENYRVLVVKAPSQFHPQNTPRNKTLGETKKFILWVIEVNLWFFSVFVLCLFLWSGACPVLSVDH